MGDNEIILSDSQPLSMEMKKAWSTLVETKTIDSRFLRSPIAKSWKRCMEFEVDPLEITRRENSTNVESLLEENRLLLDASRESMQNINEILQEHHFLIVLVSPDGYILQASGDAKAVHDARAVNICIGVKCTEEIFGTTASGVCLYQRAPVQVYGSEYYCQVFHGWCGSAAPITTAKRGLVGVLSVASMNSRRHSPQIMSIVRLAARSIETEINRRMAVDDFYGTKYRLASIVDNSPQPMLIFDNKNHLTHFNHAALKLLHARTNDLISRTAADLLAGNPLKTASRDGGWNELTFRVASKEIRLNARVIKLSDSDIESLGTMVLLREGSSGSKDMPGRLSLRFSFLDFIHRCPEMAALITEAKYMASMEHPVLLEGESGTGKEVLAQAIHNESARRDRPFIPINCAALPRELIQSELFGYESGAFTGANRSGQAGKFEQAHGGTIFLDEIGDMPLEAQANLLRVLQDKILVRIGGCKSRQVDVRVIAATNKNPFELVKTGMFREDLYYRLSVINLRIPPLRDRRKDLWLLIEHFLRKHGGDGANPEEIAFEPCARTRLEEYDWPGNIRELENAIIVAMAKMKHGVITVRDLPLSIVSSPTVKSDADNLDEIESKAIHNALHRCNGRVAKAAKLLGISRATLYRKLKRYESEEEGA